MNKITKATKLQQIYYLSKQQLSIEFQSRDRLMSPLLFSITILLLFTFSFGEFDKSLLNQFFTAEVFLAIFLSLQLILMRSFDSDQEDGALDLIRTYPIWPASLFLAKLITVSILCIMIAIPTILLGCLLLAVPNPMSFFTPILGIVLLLIIGLVPLGLLLAAIVIHAQARQIIYPLLYYPLCTPALLAGVQSSLLYLENGKFTDSLWNWLGLLLAFDIIYLTLGVLLFIELFSTQNIEIDKPREFRK